MATKIIKPKKGLDDENKRESLLENSLLGTLFIVVLVLGSFSAKNFRSQSQYQFQNEVSSSSSMATTSSTLSALTSSTSTPSISTSSKSSAISFSKSGHTGAMSDGPESMTVRDSTPSLVSVSKRTPASLAQTEEVPTMEQSLIQVDCQSNIHEISVEMFTPSLRIESQRCFHRSVKEVSLVNKSNGYTASIFYLPNKEFTTDFIQLQEGKNELILDIVPFHESPIRKKITIYTQRGQNLRF